MSRAGGAWVAREIAVALLLVLAAAPSASAPRSRPSTDIPEIEPDAGARLQESGTNRTSAMKIFFYAG
jgi:hypothetical protein